MSTNSGANSAVSRDNASRASLEKLAASARYLNQETDQFSKIITNLEAILKRLNIGVSASVSFATSTSDTARYEDFIEYDRHKGSWGIVIQSRITSDFDPDDSASTVVPFNEASREMRLDAAKKLPELVEKLTENTAELAAKISKRNQHLSEFSATLDIIAGTAKEGK